MELKIGDKVKGFEFPSGTDGAVWIDVMKGLINKEGRVIYILGSFLLIGFSEEDHTAYAYPISMWESAVVEEEENVKFEIDHSADNNQRKNYTVAEGSVAGKFHLKEDEDSGILALIDKYWKFDEDQQHLSSWHDKQDLLKAVKKKLERL